MKLEQCGMKQKQKTHLYFLLDRLPILSRFKSSAVISCLADPQRLCFSLLVRVPCFAEVNIMFGLSFLPLGIKQFNAPGTGRAATQICVHWTKVVGLWTRYFPQSYGQRRACFRLHLQARKLFRIALLASHWAFSRVLVTTKLSGSLCSKSLMS